MRVDGGQVMIEHAVVCIMHSRWGIRHWYEGTNIAWGFCSCNCQMVAASRPVVKIVNMFHRTKSRENVSDLVLCEEIWLDVGIGGMKFCFRHSHWFFHVFIIYPHKYFVERTSFFASSVFLSTFISRSPSRSSKRCGFHTWAMCQTCVRTGHLRRTVAHFIKLPVFWHDSLLQGIEGQRKNSLTRARHHTK